MTRAEDELCCTWAAERRVGDRPVERRLTPWLAGLAERRAADAAEADADAPGPFPDWRRHLADQRDTLADAAPGPSPDWRRHLADQRAALDDAAPGPSPALAALHDWREAHARAARVEPAALVDDRLLAAIAERRPATPDELAEVPGMGPQLAARVGDGLLAALRPPADGS
jgi:superfamily II DNA helicase RecQ